MPYQVKLKAAEQWTLSRTAWTNTGQKIPQMSELTGSNQRCRAQLKFDQTVVGQRFAGNGPNGLSYYYNYLTNANDTFWRQRQSLIIESNGPFFFSEDSSSWNFFLFSDFWFQNSSDLNHRSVLFNQSFSPGDFLRNTHEQSQSNSNVLSQQFPWAFAN